MLNKIGWSLLLLLVLAFLSPLFLYWWGLSNLDEPPVPSEIKLTPDRELMIWKESKEVGEPRVRPITVYGYLLHVRCQVIEGLYATECMNKYPGLRLASLSIRNQVAEKVGDQGSSVWQVTWAAYSVWVTRNWNIHQILATYDETYGA